ncbi:hypothetical protein SHIRM173S_09617 [Streptomyces hirsutus]
MVCCVCASAPCLAATSGHSTMSPSSPCGGSASSFVGGRSSSIGNDMTSVGPGRSIHWMWSSSMAAASTTITESSESGWMRIRASA